MKKQENYQPPDSWVPFGNLKPGDKFHDIYDGKIIQFVKIQSNKENAVSLQDGKLWTIEEDEYVDAGWPNLNVTDLKSVRN